MFKRFFAAFLALCLVMALVASFISFRSAPASASSVWPGVNHQSHVHLHPNKVVCPTVCTLTVTVDGVGLTPGDTYILFDGFMPPQASGNDSEATAIKADSTGFLSKLVTAGGVKTGHVQVELVDAEDQREFWYAILTVVH